MLIDVCICRFNDDTILKSLLYFPIGITLVVIRIVIGICVWLISALSPEVSVVRTLIANFTCFSLGNFIYFSFIHNDFENINNCWVIKFCFSGIHVKCTGERDDKTRLIVANAVSIFDSLALNVSTNSISVSWFLFYCWLFLYQGLKFHILYV